jgi:hypothetical protein
MCSHLSEVVRFRSLFSSSEDEFTGSGGGERPCCSCSRWSSLYLWRRSYLLILLSFTRAARSRSLRCPTRLLACDRGISGSDIGALTPTPCHQTVAVRPNTEIKKAKGEGMVLTWSTSGSIANDHRWSSLFCTALGFTARLACVVPYP